MAWPLATVLLIVLIVGVGLVAGHIAGAGSGFTLAIGLVVTVLASAALYRLNTQRRPIRRVL
jgi:uncharacterized transporter YbjL